MRHNRTTLRHQGSAAVSVPLLSDIGTLTVAETTFHSVGVTWDIPTSFDTDHNGVVAVEYRKTGAGAYLSALNLIRTDYTYEWPAESFGDPVNNFAGSVMFLTPDTSYDVRLTYSDPDEVEESRQESFTVSTRAIPVKPTGGTTYYCIAGSGSGNAGTAGDPFEGLAEADAAVSAGDTVLLRDTAGTFTGISTLSTSGGLNNHIVYEADAGHTPDFEAVSIIGDYIWFEGATLTANVAVTDPTSGQLWGISVPWAATKHKPTGIVITGCSLTGYLRAIVSDIYGPDSTNWTVMDNTIIGDKAVGVGKPPYTVDIDGEGVRLGFAGGHVVAYNSITRVADGIDAAENMDVYGNDVFDTSDDSIECDSSVANLRVWGNRLHQTATYNLSFQPQNAGPWYFLYNQMAEADGVPFKLSELDRCVFINNTVIDRTGGARAFMKWIHKNNLWIGDGVSTLWDSGDGGNNPVYSPNWQTDVDYDGFDADGANYFRWWNGSGYSSYSSLATFVAAVGIEANGVEVVAASIFDNYTVDPTNSLELASGVNAAVDAGIAIDNLSDFYEGTAPDLGAHERGATSLQFGPRNTSVELNLRAENWIKH